MMVFTFPIYYKAFFLRSLFQVCYNNNNNIPRIIPQPGSEEGGVYTALPLPCEGRETVFK